MCGVRRAFLCSDDVEHRRTRVRDVVRDAAGAFAVDELAYAVMSTHFLLVVRIDPQRVRADCQRRRGALGQRRGGADWSACPSRRSATRRHSAAGINWDAAPGPVP